jgi:hypothetical protein
MNTKVIERKMDPRKVVIKMVDGSLIHGKVNIYSLDDVIERVSDIFTRAVNPFVVVFDATAEGKTGMVLSINKRNISWVSHEFDQRQEHTPATMTA